MGGWNTASSKLCKNAKDGSQYCATETRTPTNSYSYPGRRSHNLGFFGISFVIGVSRSTGQKPSNQEAKCEGIASVGPVAIRCKAKSRNLCTVSLKHGTRFGVTREEEEEVEVEQHMRAMEGLLRAGYHDQAFKRYKHLQETNRLRVRQFDKAIRVFGELDSLRTAWMIYEDFSSEDCREEPQLSSHNTILELCAARKDTAKLKVAFQRLRKSRIAPNLFSYKSYISTLAQVGESREVEEAMRDMEAQEIKPDSSIMRSVMRMYTSQKNLSAVKFCYSRMQMLNIKPDRSTFNMYIDAIGKQESLKEAEDAFLRMDKHGKGSQRPDVVTYNTLMKLHASRGRLDRAKDFYQQMIATGLKPTEITFTILLGALAKAGDIRSAKSAFKEMERRGVKPQINHFNCVIELYLKKRQHAAVYEQYLELRRLGYRPDRHTYNLVLTSYVREKKETEALALFEEMRVMYVRPDRNTFALLMRLYSNSTSVQKCRYWFDYMLKDGIDPGEVNYALLLEAYLKAQLLSEAERVATEAQRRSIVAKTRLCTALMALATKQGDQSRVRELAQTLYSHRKDWRFELNDLESILVSLSKTREHDLAAKFYAEIIAKGWEPSVRSRHIKKMMSAEDSQSDWETASDEEVQPFIELIDRFARSKDVLRANRAFKRMIHENVLPTTNVYNALIRAYCLGGETGQALNTLEELLESPALTPNEGTFKPLVLALIRDKDIAQAKSVLAEARRAGIDLDLRGEPNNSKSGESSSPIS